jgi:hypothetical protein
MMISVVEKPMKNITKFFAVALLVLVPFMALQAQDSTVLPEDFAGTMSLDLPMASYADGVLMVEALPEVAEWFAITPDLDAGEYAIANLFGDWATSEAVADAVIVIDGVRYVVTLSVADFDSVENIVSLNVELSKVLSTTEIKGEAKLPASFENAKLNIKMSNDFAAALLTGYSDRVATTRIVQPCPPFRNC